VFKYILLVTLVFSSHAAFAGDCKNLPSKVDNDVLYSEIISRTHMDLEFIFVRKDARAFQYKIVGGDRFSPSALPTCDGPAALVSQPTDNVAVAQVYGGNNSFYAIYKICMYDYLNQPIGETTLCGWETGD
jgi:hypothetical protein